MKNKNKDFQQFALLLWFKRHLAAAKASLDRMALQPFASLMTICVIGIALALPAALYVVLQNSKAVTESWQRGTQISAFLKLNVEQADVDNALKQLRLRDDVGAVNYISPQQGLIQLQQQAGFGDVLSQLPDNPLPGVIEIYPAASLQTPAAIQNLLVSVQQLPQVDSAKLDMQWLQRLYSIVALTQRSLYALMILLGLGVLLVIGNTIRLATQNHRKEIEVIKLVGATNGFIRRPFLYTGFYYGFFGGLFAWISVAFLLWWLNSPVQRLVVSYGANFKLLGLGVSHGAGLLLVSASLGLMGAWFAVNRHLMAAEPR